MSSQPKSTTTRQITELPAEIKPYVSDVLTKSKGLYDQGPKEYYPGQTIAQFSPQTQQALSQKFNYSLNDPLGQQATGYLTGALGGQYLNSNPYIDRAYDSAANAITRNYNQVVRPGVDSAFARSNRLGSNAYGTALEQSNDTLARNLGNLASGMYYQNYEAERGRQNQAAALSPSVNQLTQGNLQNALQTGLLYDDLAQRNINADIARYNYEQNAPYESLDKYLGAIYGAPRGSTTSTQTPYFTNPIAQALGLGSMLYGNFGGNTGTSGGGVGGLGGVLGGLGMLALL